MSKDENGLSKLRGVYVEVKKGGDKVRNLEDALKKFKRKQKDANLMLIINENLYFKKPSEVKRNKKSLAKLRAKYQN